MIVNEIRAARVWGGGECALQGKFSHSIEAFFQLSRCETPTIKGYEAIEAVDAAITEAVKRHLISDVPVGGFLSGQHVEYSIWS